MVKLGSRDFFYGKRQLVKDLLNFFHCPDKVPENLNITFSQKSEEELFIYVCVSLCVCVVTSKTNHERDFLQERHFLWNFRISVQNIFEMCLNFLFGRIWCNLNCVSTTMIMIISSQRHQKYFSFNNWMVFSDQGKCCSLLLQVIFTNKIGESQIIGS